MAAEAALVRALKRDRLIVTTALAAVILAAWAYVLTGAGMSLSALETTRLTAGDQAPLGQPTEGALAMTMPAVWTPHYAVLMVFMWWIMMIAMMLPSASPMILLFAAINRKQRERGDPYVSASVFGAAYLLVWAGFSLLAVALQWSFERLAWLSPTWASTSTVLGGLLLLGAGVYQLTPVKQACLKHCRSPVHFISSHWRRGRAGALIMGLEHGAYCIGCCWFLMGLLFFGGVMNLYWIAGLALFVLFEKTVPAGHWLGAAAGLALMAWGGWILVEAI